MDDLDEIIIQLGALPFDAARGWDLHAVKLAEHFVARAAAAPPDRLRAELYRAFRYCGVMAAWLGTSDIDLEAVVQRDALKAEQAQHVAEHAELFDRLETELQEER